MTDAPQPATLSLAMERRIDAVCRRFETAWQSGQRPVIEEYLGEIPPEGRSALLAELVKLDVCYRRPAGEQPTLDDYRKRFPNDTELLERVMNASAAEATSAASNDTASSTPDWSPAGGPRYVPVRFHAKGGLGEVHVARDAELRRDVALKRIQGQYAGDAESRRRFLAEAEITGRLEHPGVVPVYGLVQGEDGEPCYAMRFIDGETLADAIRRLHGAGPDPSGLALRQLLARFVTVCNTLAYAHSRGIVHRDLKPANVMLGKFGETLVVDWGLAKPFDRDNAARSSGEESLVPAATPPLADTAETGGTRTGAALGTPAYMSPEQARGDRDRMGPASDVFGLGAILYALLTGRAPYEGGPDEAVRRAARAEFPSPRSINRAVPPALEAVCVKAMAADPGNRYPSALALAVDVERWLADEPVSAASEPVFVRTRRWVRKHPAIVATLTASLLVGLLGLAGGLYFVSAQRAIAEQNLAYAKKGNEVLGSVFGGLHPKQNYATVAEFAQALRANLSRAVAELDDLAFGDPHTVAVMQNNLGVSLLGLGQPREAAAVLEKALATCQAKLGPDHPDTLKSMINLSASYGHLGRHAEALRLDQRALEPMKVKLGSDHPDTLRCMHNLAAGNAALGRHDKALALHRHTLELQKAKLGPEHIDTLWSMNSLAACYIDLGRYDEALALLPNALELQKAKLGTDHPYTLRCMNYLAISYIFFGRADEALTLLPQALELMKAKLGPDHPDTLRCMNNLVISYLAQGRYDEALPLGRQGLELMKAKLGLDHSDTLRCMNNLGVSYDGLGRHDEALSVQRQMLEIQKTKLGPDHPNTLYRMKMVADSYTKLGRIVEAAALHEVTLRIRRDKLGPDHPDTLLDITSLVESYVLLDRGNDALALIDDALPRAIGNPGVHPQVVPQLMDSRVRIFEKKYDPVGCRATAQMWEELNRTDVGSLYNAACFRSVCAAVELGNKEPSAGEQAERAIAWLTKAVTAGFTDAEQMKKDPDLAALRDRDDFKKLVADLEAKAAAAKPAGKAAPAKPDGKPAP